VKSVQKVITNLVPEGLPEDLRLGWHTLHKDHHKEVSQLIARLPPSSLCETVDPLVVILQKSKSKASCLESGMNCVVDSSQTFPRLCSPNCAKQKTQEETFPSRRWSKVDPTNGKTFLSWTPFVLLPDKVLWELVVEILACLRKVAVGLKPAHESCWFAN
jgi:hypothetical protein